MNNMEVFLFTLLFSFSLLFPGNSLATIDQISVVNLNVNYDGHGGSGSFDRVSVNGDKFEVDSENMQLDILKEESHIIFSQVYNKIKLPTTEGDIFSSLGVIQIENLNLFIKGQSKIGLNFNKAKVEIGDGSHTVRELKASCKSGLNRNGDIFSFLLPCLDQGQFTLPELNLSKESQKTMFHAFNVETFKSFYQDEGEDLSNKSLTPDKLKNVRFTLNNKKFNLDAKVKILFDLKLNAYGNVTFHQQNSELEIHVSKVKVGIFNITKKVLKEVKEAKIKNVKVSGNSIFIQL